MFLLHGQHNSLCHTQTHRHAHIYVQVIFLYIHTSNILINWTTCKTVTSQLLKKINEQHILELVFCSCSMQLVILLLSDMYSGKIHRHDILPLHAVNYENGPCISLLKVDDCGKTLPPIFPACLQSIHPRKQKQTDISHQYTL